MTSIPASRISGGTPLPGEYAVKDLRVHVPAGHDGAYPSSAEAFRIGQERADAESARGLGFEIREREQEPNRFGDVLLGHLHDGFDAILQDRPVVLAEAHRAGAVGEGHGLALVFHYVPRGERPSGIVSEKGLGADDPGLPVAGLPQSLNDSRAQPSP